MSTLRFYFLNELIAIVHVFWDASKENSTLHDTRNMPRKYTEMNRDGERESGKERERKRKCFVKRILRLKSIYGKLGPENYKALKIIHQKHAYTRCTYGLFDSRIALCAWAFLVISHSASTLCECIASTVIMGIMAFMPLFLSKMKFARKIMNIYSRFYFHFSKEKKRLNRIAK